MNFKEITSLYDLGYEKESDILEEVGALYPAEEPTKDDLIELLKDLAFECEEYKLNDTDFFYGMVLLENGEAVAVANFYNLDKIYIHDNLVGEDIMVSIEHSYGANTIAILREKEGGVLIPINY